MKGFIYLWRDSLKNMYYIGSHKGTPDDGYICSSSWMKKAYKKRPNTFKRRILERLDFFDRRELLALEHKWLSLIDEGELGKKYYNLKKIPEGGDIVSSLSFEKRQRHKERSLRPRFQGLKFWREENPERVREIAKHARSCVKNVKTRPMFGEENHFFGKKHTEESKEKMRKRKIGWQSNRKGVSLSEETKKLISKNNPNSKRIKTPFGVFDSFAHFSKEIGCITDRGVYNIFKVLDTPLSKKRCQRCPLFTEEDLNKTPRELGYNYE